MAHLDPQLIDSIDQLFNAWLARNNILSKEGYLYQVDDNGNLMHDVQGHPVKVDVSLFKLLIADNMNGFSAYAASKGIRVKAVERAFPNSL